MTDYFLIGVTFICAMTLSILVTVLAFFHVGTKTPMPVKKTKLVKKKEHSDSPDIQKPRPRKKAPVYFDEQSLYEKELEESKKKRPLR